MTGLSLMAGDLSGKRVALLKEAVPELKRLAFVIDPSDPNSNQIGDAKKTVDAQVYRQAKSGSPARKRSKRCSPRSPKRVTTAR